jgi:hypothetical protein
MEPVNQANVADTDFFAGMYLFSYLCNLIYMCNEFKEYRK